MVHQLQEFKAIRAFQRLRIEKILIAEAVDGEKMVAFTGQNNIDVGMPFRPDHTRSCTWAVTEEEQAKLAIQECDELMFDYHGRIVAIIRATDDDRAFHRTLNF